MILDNLNADEQAALEAALGYLNFSAGAEDPKFLKNISALYRAVDADQQAQPWEVLRKLFEAKLDQLQGAGGAFSDTTQVRQVIVAAQDEVLPGYRAHHRDLLFHQSDAFLFDPFFLGRVYEAVLRARAEASEHEIEIQTVLQILNDFVGHRPIATLETKQKIQIYDHERCRPVPIYIRGAGAVCGPYEAILQATFEILAQTDPHLLEQAYFDLEKLDELAIDPRCYDFEHPVNKRPNYQFGQWDPHHIDNAGYYRRFVIQQVTIDALLERVETMHGISHDELLFEAAAALAGTILMASGVSGDGPEAHSSDVTLNNLLPQIAAFRDKFYDTLLERHADNDRLIAEATHLKQAFGGVRQHLNAELSRRRASQLEHAHVAKLYARMGYPEASARQVRAVPTTSTRMICMIQCLITEAHFQLDETNLAAAAAYVPKAVDLLHRGIHCGGIVDPWNILGFDANFSLFPALENSVHDHRVDELLELMEQLFALCSRVWCLTAAADQTATAAAIANQFSELATWWDQFAVTAVSDIDGMAARQLYEAAEAAAGRLAAWQGAGSTAGDIAFWQPHAEAFESPKAYVLVLDALLDRGDLVASMALLIHWLSQSDRVRLQEGSDWFHIVATRWMDETLKAASGASSGDEVSAAGESPTSPGSAQPWKLVCKFFDYLEANAEEYWEVPKLEADSQLAATAILEDDEGEDEPEAEESDDLYAAAYEDFTYRDSTADGIDSQLIGDDFPETDDYALEHEIKRISDRLAFLITLARLWKRTAQALVGTDSNKQPSEDRAAADDRLGRWLNQILSNRAKLYDLLREVSRHKLAPPSAVFSSMIEYDRRRLIQESLLERISASCVAYTEAAQFLLAAGGPRPKESMDTDILAVADMLQAALLGDVKKARRRFPLLLDALSDQTLLYVPLSKGGDAERMTKARTRHRALRLTLALLPRLGMLAETAQLLQRCTEMERTRPAGPGAVTEFDQLFKIGHQAMVQCIIKSSESWQSTGDSDAEHDLVEYLQHLTEAMMRLWMNHSRTLRLSVLEKVSKEKRWQRLVQFVQQHGHDLFDQSFFNMGNLRAILYRGVEPWLEDLAQAEHLQEPSVLATLDEESSRRKTIEHLQIVIEAIVENYVEYRDYNGTTTQSDRGELLYTLLDMLRLRVGYDRMAWNLAPLVLTHEVLVSQRRTAAANYWRDEMVKRTNEMAGDLVSRLHELQRHYGIRLSTVSDRVAERFVRPLLIDRVRAQVKPAMAESRTKKPHPSFEDLERGVDELMKTPTGVGLDLPAWLEALEEEVERNHIPHVQREMKDEIPTIIPQRRLTRHEAQEQLEAL